MMRRRRLIYTQDLTKYYGKVVGIESLFLEVAEGESFGLLGLDGSGKTTAVQLLLGLVRPTRGQGEVMGFNIAKHSHQIRRLAGCMPGGFSFYEDLTGDEFLALCSRLRRNQAHRRSELVEKLELDPGRKFLDYSLVDKRKIALVQALMHDPQLLILDNPTIGLDHLSKETVYEMLMEERAKGKTLILSTNSPSEITRLCDRVGILRAGYLAQTQDVAELRNRLGRRVQVTFHQDVDLEDIITEDVSVISHEGRQWVLAVRHEMGSLIKRIAEYSVADVKYLEGTMEEALIGMLRSERRALY
ncbi:MAG: ABC transporter ATP-binding protein [Dehalococcoidia bacterium]